MYIFGGKNHTIDNLNEMSYFDFNDKKWYKVPKDKSPNCP